MPSVWLEDIVTALENLGGTANYSDLYEEVRRIRRNQLKPTWKNIIRRTIQTHSSDSQGFKGNDVFYSVGGLGSGTWGLKEKIRHTPIAADLGELEESRRTRIKTYRILRDTLLARTLKEIHQNRCQICGESLRLSDGAMYAEAHHIKPLGRPHNGPDIEANILILCPNHHVLCDYGALRLILDELHHHPDHSIEAEFVEYHNEIIVGGSKRLFVMSAN